MGHDHGRLDEPAFRGVAAAAEEHGGVFRFLGAVDIALDGLVGVLVDHGADEVAKIAHVAHLDRFHHGPELGFDLGPDALRDVGARGGRALLALELEGAAQHGHGQCIDIRRAMGHDEVLAAGLAHDARVGAVGGDVLADRFPHVLEDGGRAREVDAGQVRVGP